MISVFERMDAAMLKYGIYAKAVELLCFQPALEKLSAVYPEMDIKSYKKNVKHEYKNMLLRTPDIGGSSLEMNLYIAAFVFSLHKAEPDKITPAVVDAMVTAVFNSPFMIKAHKNKKCTLFTDKVQDKKVKESIASQTSEYALDWKLKKAWMSSIIHTQNAVSVSWASERTALNLFPVCAIWMRETTETKADSCTVPKRWHRGMTAATFMLQR